MSLAFRARLVGVGLLSTGALVGAVVVSGQATSTQTAGTALIVGTVVDGDSGSILSGAVVTLGVGQQATGRARAAGAAIQGTETQPRVMAASDGRFMFRNLPKGS